MANKRGVNFISSPFKTVTEYEDEFVISFNNNLSEAVTEMLKYIAKVTASAVKNTEQLNEVLKEDLKAAEAVVDTNPTQNQIDAENYKKGHVEIQGFKITIENPKGGYRSGTDKAGKRWTVKMKNTYGYFKNSVGNDYDAVDVFIGDNLVSDKVYIVDQFLDDKFDEHKVMFGFDSKAKAMKAYLSNYQKGWKGLKYITETTVEEFKEWLQSNDRKTKPYHDVKVKQ